jgi:hypothetical protein
MPERSGHVPAWQRGKWNGKYTFSAFTIISAFSAVIPGDCDQFKALIFLAQTNVFCEPMNTTHAKTAILEVAIRWCNDPATSNFSGISSGRLAYSPATARAETDHCDPFKRQTAATTRSRRPTGIVAGEFHGRPASDNAMRRRISFTT